ncbi:hypothetical protein [Streptomyces sp. NPDC006739]|uniref:hypothetical protein n=1 Tax=Streptomyces sp. NPDC006739 TaxID=3364763 RepID=UPI0036935942
MSDEERENLLQHLYKVLCQDIPACGCGDPQASHTLVHDLLRLTPFYEDGRWRDAEKLIGTSGAVQIVLSALTDADLLEHGGTVGGSWITDKGRWLLWAIDQSGGIHGLDERLDDAGLPHWDHEAKKIGGCTAECWRVPADSEPQPEPPSLDALVAEQQSAKAAWLDSMPAEMRDAWQAADQAVENMLLWGNLDGPPPDAKPGPLFDGIAGFFGLDQAVTLAAPFPAQPSPPGPTRMRYNTTTKKWEPK